MSCMQTRIVTCAALLLVCSGGCGGSGSVMAPDITGAAAVQLQFIGLPAALPIDSVQPWEALNDESAAIPNARAMNCINADSVFVAGVERHASSLIGTSDNGEACRMTSGDAGSGDVTWAYWRLTMGGEQPGAISADVNLLSMSDDSQSAYYIGLSDYGNGCWQWHGPCAENHVRLCAPPGDYLSDLGNLFVCVVACDGATFDVVAVAANACDGGDSEAPAAPAGLTAAAFAGGIELSWDEVSAADLAGYRIYYSDNWFLDAAATSVRCLPGLEGLTRCMLPATEETYMRISAIDTSGNASTLSEIASALPLTGSVPDVRLAASAPSALIGESISLTAAGAELYDWDLDGDGIFEVSGDATGEQEVDTSRAGLIRPLARGMIGDGSCRACGGVSVLVGSNSRPLAMAYAEPAFGLAPLSVTFTGTGEDDDGIIAGYAWDFDGDGTYDFTHATEPNPPIQQYDTPGTYNVKFRVEDDLGLIDVDTLAISVSEPDIEHGWVVVTVDSEGSVGDTACLAVIDGCPAIGYPDDTNGYLKYARATTGTGASESDWTQIVTVDDSGNNFTFISLAVVDGCPAMCYCDETSRDLKYARATTSTGSDAADWTQMVTVASTDFSGPYNSLAVVDGCPAISYVYIDLSDSSLMYARATTSTGGQASDWTQFVTVDGPGSIGGLSSLTVVDGCPAISYVDEATDDLKYARATTSSGADASDWTQLVNVVHIGSDNIWLSLAVVDGCPAISYHDQITPKVWYARATTSTGSSASDWTQIVNVAIGGETSLAVVDGCPAIAYRASLSNSLNYARAKTSTGESSADWTTISIVDWTGDTGYEPSLKSVNGRAAIAYFDNTDSDLKYAINL